MADKRKLAVLAAILLLLITAGAAFFVIKSYVWSSGSEEAPAAPANIAAPSASAGPQIQVGILLSDFSATGPHRQTTPYGYQAQIRAVRSLRDSQIHLVPIIEPNTARKGQLPGILSRNFEGVDPIDVTNLDQMRKINVLCATAACNVTGEEIRAVTERVREGMGLVQRQFGYLTPGYNASTDDLCGFSDGVFGFSGAAVDCEVIGDHPLLGDLAGQIGKTISLIPNGTIGTLRGLPLLRVKNMRQVKAVAADRTVSTGEYLYPLYISQLGKGKIIGIGFTQTRDVPEALDAAHKGRFYVHCIQWLMGKPLN